MVWGCHHWSVSEARLFCYPVCLCPYSAVQACDWSPAMLTMVCVCICLPSPSPAAWIQSTNAMTPPFRRNISCKDLGWGCWILRLWRVKLSSVSPSTGGWFRHISNPGCHSCSFFIRCMVIDPSQRFCTPPHAIATFISAWLCHTETTKLFGLKSGIAVHVYTCGGYRCATTAPHRLLKSTRAQHPSQTQWVLCGAAKR